MFYFLCCFYHVGQALSLVCGDGPLAYLPAVTHEEKKFLLVHNDSD